MIYSKKIKLTISILFFILFCSAFLVFSLYEDRLCMGVPVLPEKALSNYSEVNTLDIHQLTFNQQNVAADVISSTIYISQSADDLPSYQLLRGQLNTKTSDYSLFFIETNSIFHLSEAVSSGTPLCLILRSGQEYQRINVIISTLPVMNLEGTVTHQDEWTRDIATGQFTLWCGYDPSVESYSTTTCATEWHLRGATSSALPHKPWKLSLKNSDGEKQNKNLLNLGSDDDWILNPMNFDDTKVKEILAMDLWNYYAKETGSPYKMSTGQYVELISNGEYQGLYLLQRRVDQKYLRLDPDIILLKGFSIWDAPTLPEGYEILFSPFDRDQTYEILDSVLQHRDENKINLQSFLDVSLFIDYFSAADNTNYKNMFYILEPSETGYQLHFLPWDTDASLGIVWKKEFVYNYEKSLKRTVKRMEYDKMAAIYPDLDELTAKRWKELRSTVYKEEVIQTFLDSYYDALIKSGALIRDETKWGLHYRGEDTREKLSLYCIEKLKNLDEKYAISSNSY